MLSVLRLRTRTWLILLLGFAFFYFYNGGGWNQASRFDLARAILEESKVTIDSYHRNTGDKAYYNGHFYCDKAPGTSFVVLPTLAVTRAALNFVGVESNSNAAIALQYRVATWTAAGLPATVLCYFVYRWLRRSDYSRRAAVYSAIAAGLASPMWVYATLYWSNALAGCCVIIAAYTVDRLIHSTPDDRTQGLAFGAGFAAGGAVLTEYPTAPLALFFSLWLLYHLRPWRAYWRHFLAFGIGALLMAGLLASYNTIAFGSPFHLGYASVQGFEGMKHGAFGVTWPRWTAIAGITWGPRGLLSTAPVLLLGLLGYIVSIARRRRVKATIIWLVCSIYPFLLNASYAYWDGGRSYGPRHMAISLPFLAMGLAPLYDALRPRSKRVAIAVLLVGIFLTLMGVSVDGVTSAQLQHPVADYYWPSFLQGEFAQHEVNAISKGGGATNLGIAIGFDVRYSLIPFGLVFIGLLIGLLYSLRREAATDAK